ncbi:nucleolus and neural progenitor protein [Hemitrygon akajei]|uniref:nucleolus and neural progenitor protein n=1 Tax=Hemitrygon akajei TaxID=2704970 RepID=UPI003BF9FA8C
MALESGSVAEVWNRADIPFPESSSLTVAATDLDVFITDLHSACENAIRVLTDKSLTVELLVLRSVIYTFHNRLHQHKSYLVIKQVEQCVNRLHKMQLNHSIQSLINSCSRVTRKRKLESNCPKQVPNQAVLEWMSLKILGSSKLILRLMDMCSKAFLLTGQFLRYGRYIVLNVIMTGILSRLWVLFKRILIYLDVLYDRLLAAVNEVSKIQYLPFVKDFTFPVSLRQWLGLFSIKGIQIKMPSFFSQTTGVPLGKPNLLDELFSEPEALLLTDDQSVLLDENKMNYNHVPKIASQFLDIGIPVQDQRLRKIGTDRQFGFKMTFQQAQRHNFAVKSLKSEGEFSCRRAKKNEQPLVPLTEFLERITAAQTLSKLCRELKTIFLWFKKRKLKHKSYYLGNQYLKCHKLKMVESLGYSFPKKINFIKSSVCKCLIKKSQRTFESDKVFKNHLSGMTFLQKYKIKYKRQLKLRKLQLRRQKSLLRAKASFLSVNTEKRRKLHAIPHFDCDGQVSVKRHSIRTNMAAEFVGDFGQDQKLKNVPHASGSPNVTNADDIDDIFASIGV